MQRVSKIKTRMCVYETLLIQTSKATDESRLRHKKMPQKQKKLSPFTSQSPHAQIAIPQTQCFKVSLKTKTSHQTTPVHNTLPLLNRLASCLKEVASCCASHSEVCIGHLKLTSETRGGAWLTESVADALWSHVKRLWCPCLPPPSVNRVIRTTESCLLFWPLPRHTYIHTYTNLILTQWCQGRYLLTTTGGCCGEGGTDSVSIWIRCWVLWNIRRVTWIWFEGRCCRTVWISMSSVCILIVCWKVWIHQYIAHQEEAKEAPWTELYVLFWIPSGQHGMWTSYF